MTARLARPLGPSDPSHLAGHRLLGLLGSGGMGTVYLARSPENALVALKVVRAGYADDPHFRARFRREVGGARRVTSWWVLPVVAADTEAAVPWLATSYVPGPSLAESVDAHGPLPERAVRVLGALLAEALASVHATGLVHRDVKPGNVLLALDGPRLIDFGIARALDDTTITSTGMVVGTPGYLSPEQVGSGADRPVGPPSDVFSLGCVLVHAAAGHGPFGDDLYATAHEEPDLGGVPDGLRPLLAACLAKDPAQRPDTAAVRRGLSGEPAGDWLPEPVVRVIEERSGAALALPPVDATEAGAGPGAAVNGPPSSGSSPSPCCRPPTVPRPRANRAAGTRSSSRTPRSGRERPPPSWCGRCATRPTASPPRGSTAPCG
ncbi:serine/threonine-protein kinase [Streptomyces sp. SBT349]|uniref:serine/threonine-protein kinase n=1 Tax=Streptomyces sp. SBT349 TaxID=1580539 RepID=UPI00099C4913